MEFIMPFDAVVNESGYREGGAYIVLCAEILADCNLHVSQIQKGAMVVINFPLKTFARSWVCVNKTFRDQLQPGDNVRVKFKKNSKQDIAMYDLERVVPTDEQREFAEKNYAVVEPSFKRKLVVRSSEEL